MLNFKYGRLIVRLGVTKLRLRSRLRLDGLVGRSPALVALVRQAALVAPLGAVYGVGAPLALAFSLGLQATVVGVSLLGGGVALVHQGLSRVRARRAIAARAS